MKILYISQYYPPEIGAPAARVSELAQQWQQDGHEVTVLTAFPHHPHGTKRPEDRFVPTRREQDRDVQLVRTYVFATKNAGFIKRILSYVSFMLSAMLIGPFRVGKPDVVIATSPQLFTAIAGWWMSKLKGVPFIFEVRDLWPESIVTVGAMREGLAIRMLKRLSHWLYRSSDHIVTVGEGYKRGIVERYGIDPAKISVVTNGVDLKLFNFEQAKRDQVREQHAWENKTVFLYLGTHGMAHGLDFVLKAAQQADDTNAHFVFIGDGAEKENLIKQAAELKLRNVEFLPPKSKQEVVGYYSASDVCLVPLRNVDLFKEVLPSKLFEIMAMERPILLSVNGDARKVVEESGAGLYVEPENVEKLSLAIATFCMQPDLGEAMGMCGRALVERQFCRTVLARRFANLLSRWQQTEPVILPANASTKSARAESSLANINGPQAVASTVANEQTVPVDQAA